MEGLKTIPALFTNNNPWITPTKLDNVITHVNQRQSYIGLSDTIEWKLIPKPNEVINNNIKPHININVFLSILFYFK
jgi:hypothetical protein